jgi:hypothetical protein
MNEINSNEEVPNIENSDPYKLKLDDKRIFFEKFQESMYFKLFYLVKYILLI